MRKLVVVKDLMQSGYCYELIAPMGEDFDDGFSPELSPREMLELGVFGGKYMTDCRDEFPRDWYAHAKLCHEFHDPKLNFFGVNASQPLSVWRAKGWISRYDPRGWFQWYCRYYMGRRIEDEDKKQIQRWKMIKRHLAQLQKNCDARDLSCRRVQRQALLHWAYDSRNY